MRLGLIARADSRGLGIQTKGYYDHLKPWRTLVVVNHNSPYPSRRWWYPNARFVEWEGGPFPSDVKKWLLRCDAILTVETPYDYDLFDEARAHGVKTVLQYNYEFFRWHHDPTLPRPDVFLAPSKWFLNRVPEAVYLPYPVDRKLHPFRLRTQVDGFVHVAGHKAIYDRNGTEIVIEALSFVKEPTRLVVTTQSKIAAPRRTGPHVELIVKQQDFDDNAELWRNGDVALQPRRYGGLSLPINEASSQGLPVLSLNIPPQNEYLQGLIKAHVDRKARFQCGPLIVYGGNPRELAASMDELTRNPAFVERLSKAADNYVDSISWERLKPKYEEILCK